MIRKKSLTKTCTVSTKLPDEQQELLQKRAKERGMTPSEFVRLLTLEALYTPSETRLMLAKMVRLQKIILSFHATVLNGGTLTRERIDSIVREADQGKFELADQRIAAGLNVPSTLDVLKAHGVRYFVEDRAETCHLLAREGIQPILYTQPWNRGVDDFPRVDDWFHLRELLCLNGREIDGADQGPGVSLSR